ncbi:proprotein convertase subtilisin/kexin type 4-like [Babylonia areolata]|uniref:proprotein convertase subtilisin/kexin type 4-like n=1 Tax=Babylonia areolata TaxID=304850 RepID=UPI003FD631D9
MNVAAVVVVVVVASAMVVVVVGVQAPLTPSTADSYDSPHHLNSYDSPHHLNSYDSPHHLNSYDNPHYLNSFAVQVDGGAEEARTVAFDLGFSVQRELPHIDVFVLEHPSVTHRSKRSADHHISRLKSHPKVRYVQQEVDLQRVKRRIIHDKQLELPIREIKDNSVFHREPLPDKALRDFLEGVSFNDPFYRDMWYLENRGQSGGEKYLDMNVQAAWASGVTGEGVVVCILDDGVDHTHPDLVQNYDPRASADLNDKMDKMHDPMPNMSNPGNGHGTRCAGEIAAAANNEVCGVGVAYNAKIGGIRILDGSVTDALEGEALAFNRDYVDIYSASWGPNDDGVTMEGPHFFAKQSLKEGVLKGRGGLGSIFVWATGNGGMNGDDCNADGYTSSLETLSVGSITDRGRQPFYMENCTSTLAVVPTGGEEYRGQEQDQGQIKLKVVTTDAGGGCIENFQGTSSAAPLAAGCIANVLQANPRLTWRDVQHVVIQGTRVPSVDGSWTINGGGHHVSHKFGFGLMDCGKMVEAAQNWRNVPEQHTCRYKGRGGPIKLGFGGTVTDKLSVDACKGDPLRWIQRLEHVQVHLKMNTQRRGDVSVILTSPAGTRSELLSQRPLDQYTGEWEFTFMTVHAWDENPEGTWQLEIHDKPKEESQFMKDEFSELAAILDKASEDSSGYLHSWDLILYGTAGQRYGRDFSSKQSMEKAYHPSEERLQRIKRNETESARNVHVKQTGPFKRRNKLNRVSSQISTDTAIDKLAARLSRLMKQEQGENHVKRFLKGKYSVPALRKGMKPVVGEEEEPAPSYHRREEEEIESHHSDALRQPALVMILQRLERLLQKDGE